MLAKELHISFDASLFKSYNYTKPKKLLDFRG